MKAYAPGRVNLIGEHTDYSGGLVCPMAIDLGTTVSLTVGGDTVSLSSDIETTHAEVSLADPLENLASSWARFVAGVVAVVRPAQGGKGSVTTTLPVGAGLSSSSALTVALALALGHDGSDPIALARSCQRAEHLTSGVQGGIMDQLVSAAGVAGHAVMIDCTTLAMTPLPLPENVEVIVVHSGESRSLAGSAYTARVDAVAAATARLGRPLASATPSDVADDPYARHVVTENQRVRDFALALATGEVRAAGRLMVESHVSLRDDFAVSTPGLDALVTRLCASPGVLGARLTGAGFGGCVVALAERGTFARLDVRERRWLVRPSAGARVLG